MNKIVILCVFLASHSVMLVAQESEVFSNQVYGHKDGMALYYDIEVPAQSSGRGIIFIVSGGWHSGKENLNISRPFWEVLLAQGYTIFQLYHPSMPTYQIPDAYEGVKSGVLHILDNASRYGITHKKIGLFGISSGGHLALLSAYDPEVEGEYEIGAVVALMPPTDLRGDEFDQILFGVSPMDFDAALIPALSPILQVDANDPPTPRPERR